MKKHIYLFRHGQASFGQANYDALSELGRHQTRRLAEHLMAEEIRLGRVVHGSLVRQRDSAAAYLEHAATLGHRPEREELPAFNEFQAEEVVRHYLPRLALEQPELSRMLGEPEGFRRHFQTLFVTVIRSWQADEHPHPRIETWTEFRQRVQAGFEALLDGLGDGEHTGVFTSGGVISVLLQPLMNEDDSLMARLNHRIANASLSLVEVDEGGRRLSRFNDYTHLEAEEMVTYR